MRRALVISLIGAIITAGVGSSAVKGGNPKLLPTTATFWNGGGDKIMSDGNPYVDGVRGVLCKVRTDPSSNYEFILNIVNTTRRLWYSFPSYLLLGCGTLYPPPTSDGLAVAGYVNFHGIGAMQVGEIRAVRANASAGSVGRFDFLDGNPVLPINPYNWSTNVAAYRWDQTHWYVSTSIDRIYPGFGGPIPDATLHNLVYPGDTAQLDDVTTRTFKGNYAMPFAVTIECPSCTQAPPTCGGGPCPIPQ